MTEHQQQMEIDIVSEARSIAEETMGPGMTDAEVEKLLDSLQGSPGPVKAAWAEEQYKVAIREISQYIALRTYEREMPPNHDVRIYGEERKEYAW